MNLLANSRPWTGGIIRARGYNLGEGGILWASLHYTPGHKLGHPVLYPGIVWSDGILWAVTPELNKACRAIRGCLKPTYVEDLYLLAGISPPDIRRNVCARMERTKQMKQETHSLFGHIPARSRLKSRKDFLTSVKPSYFPAIVVRCNEWQRRSRDTSRLGMVN